MHLRLGRLHLEVGRDVVYGGGGDREGRKERLKGALVIKAEMRHEHAGVHMCTHWEKKTPTPTKNNNPADTEGMELFPFFSAAADWELEGQQRSLPKTVHGISCNCEKKKKMKRKKREREKDARALFYPVFF